MTNRSVNRRKALLAFLSAVSFAASATRSIAATTSFRHPPTTAFESGDLLWTAPNNAMILYSSDSASIEWQKARNRHLERFSSEVFDARLTSMSYERFRSLYFYDYDQTGPVPFAGAIGVGHIAILVLENGHRSVIEATPRSLSPTDLFGISPGGVIETSYAEWIRKFDNHKVWHGRLRGFDPKSRAQVPITARRYLDRPYDFWNFDLSDVSGFYCSKLVWLSVKEALGLAIDGKADSKRKIWLSPKQMLNRREEIKMINVPGVFGRG